MRNQYSAIENLDYEISKREAQIKEAAKFWSDERKT